MESFFQLVLLACLSTVIRVIRHDLMVLILSSAGTLLEQVAVAITEA